MEQKLISQAKKKTKGNHENKLSEKVVVQTGEGVTELQNKRKANEKHHDSIELFKWIDQQGWSHKRLSSSFKILRS